ncbi:hypothetical protein E2C01_056484 [Portunus trituberculatus]|uniref:Uncharacterized protein n=1 Tax=Portunus trituberculatus TaxID=210409 RepID=A0A5B7GXT9_PORTR|nr:hypothetical protein [Portunus trituberculatus]
MRHVSSPCCQRLALPPVPFPAPPAWMFFNCLVIFTCSGINVVKTPLVHHQHQRQLLSPD